MVQAWEKHMKGPGMKHSLQGFWTFHWWQFLNDLDDSYNDRVVDTVFVSVVWAFLMRSPDYEGSYLELEGRWKSRGYATAYGSLSAFLQVCAPPPPSGLAFRALPTAPPFPPIPVPMAVRVCLSLLRSGPAPPAHQRPTATFNRRPPFGSPPPPPRRRRYPPAPALCMPHSARSTPQNAMQPPPPPPPCAGHVPAGGREREGMVGADRLSALATGALSRWVNKVV